MLIRLYTSLLLAAAVVTLDLSSYLTGRVYGTRHLISVFYDSSIHGIIAFLVWLCAEYIDVSEITVDKAPLAAQLAQFVPAGLGRMVFTVTGLRHSDMGQILQLMLSSLCCGVLSCCLDFDHFLAADGWSFSGAMSLSARPFGHSVTFLAAVWLFFHFCVGNVLVTAFVLVAWGTHQLRDSVKHGLYFAPIGSTPALPYPLYVLLIALSPSAVLAALRAVPNVPAQLRGVHQKLDDDDVVEHV